VIYNTEGKYDVSLVASNVFYSDSIYYKDYIEARATPQGTFTQSVTGFKVQFNNSTTGGTNYFWDFGDRKISFEKNPLHDYGVEGDFIVHLIAQNECGVDTISKSIAVYLVPKVQFKVDTVIGCEPFTVKFHDHSSSDVIEWSWLFENGNPSSSKEINPTVVFNKIGKYTVGLSVKNTNGTNSLIKTQYIQVVSTVYCPESTKTKRFLFSENPFQDSQVNRNTLQDNRELFIFPNPAREYIHVAFETKNEPVQIAIYDLTGRIIYTAKYTGTGCNVNTANWNKGTYFLRIVDQQTNLTGMFVVEN
jgi:PKD repeat protein